MIEAAINVIITIPLICVWGVNGALIGTISAHLYRWIKLLIFGQKFFSLTISKVLSLTMQYAFSNLVIVLLTWELLVKNFQFDNWFSWIFIASVITLLSVIGNSFLFKIFDKENFTYYKNLLLNIFIK